MAILRYEKLTVKAQDALQAAQDIAEKSGQQQIEPLHLLNALVSPSATALVPPLLGDDRFESPRPETLSHMKCAAQLERLPKVTGVSQQFLSPATNRILESAFDEAAKFKDEYVSAEHYLAGHLLRQSPILPGQLLNRAGASHEAPDSAKALTAVRGSHRVTSQTPGIHLPGPRTVRSRPHRSWLRRGKLDPVIGRDDRNPPRHAEFSLAVLQE